MRGVLRGSVDGRCPGCRTRPRGRLREADGAYAFAHVEQVGADHPKDRKQDGADATCLEPSAPSDGRSARSGHRPTIELCANGRDEVEKERVAGSSLVPAGQIDGLESRRGRVAARRDRSTPARASPAHGRDAPRRAHSRRPARPSLRTRARPCNRPRPVRTRSVRASSRRRVTCGPTRRRGHGAQGLRDAGGAFLVFAFVGEEDSMAHQSMNRVASSRRDRSAPRRLLPHRHCGLSIAHGLRLPFARDNASMRKRSSAGAMMPLSFMRSHWAATRCQASLDFRAVPASSS